MRWIKRSLLVLLLLIASVTFLFYYNPLPDTHQQAWPLEALDKTFAATDPASLPIAIHSEEIAYGIFPPCFAVANCQETRTRVDFTSFQILYANGKSIIIDLVHDEAMHQATPFMSSDYNRSAAQRMISASKQAAHIVFTHEHFDHLQGLKGLLDKPEVTQAVRLNQAQADNPLLLESGFTETELPSLQKLVKLNDNEQQILEPGFAIIKTPGHSLGSQIFYVQLKNGKRFLFVGDIVWSEANLTQKKGKPYIASLLASENSQQLNQQIRYLIELQQQRPDIHLVISHAGEQLKNYNQQKLINSEFVVK